MPPDNKQPLASEGLAFFDDRPISGRKEDKLSRAKLAERIANAVSAPGQTSGMVAAIHGAWGEGKTSILRMIEEELNNSNRAICVRFNPWQFGNQERLLKGFFVTLGDILGQEFWNLSADIGHLLRQYGGLLSFAPVPFFGGLIQFPAGSAAKEIGRNLSNIKANDLKEKIESILTRQNRRVVVFVDDIDRLDRDEIHEVLKLVKHTADFKNTTYILAFDQDIVAASIEERYADGGIEAGRSFLEKIIQFSFPLGSASAHLMKQMFHDEVARVLDIHGAKLSEAEFIDFYHSSFDTFEKKIKTIRRLKKYANGLMFALSNLKGEVNVRDLMLIEAIRHFYPSLYEYIRGTPELFLKGGILPLVKEHKIAEDMQNAVDRALRGLTASEKENVINWLIIALFPAVSDLFERNSTRFLNEDKWAEEKRACSKQYFYRYFSYGVGGDDVSDVDVENFIASIDRNSESEIEQNILLRIDGGIFPQFIGKLKIYHKKIPHTSAQRLALALARVSDQISHERYDFFTILDETAYLVSRLVQIQPSINKRFSLAEGVVSDSRSLVFAGRIFKAINSSNREDNLLIQKIGGSLAARVQNAIEQNLFFDSISDVGILLYVWRNHGNQDTKKVLRASFRKSDGNLDKFLKGVAGFGFSSRVIGSKVNDLNKEHYESICKFTDAQMIADMLLARYGGELNNPQYEMESETPVNLRLANQFMYIHNNLSGGEGGS